MISGQKPQKRKKLRHEVDRTELANNIHGLDSHIKFQDKKWKKLDSSVNFASTDCTHFVSLGESPKREKLFIQTDSLTMLTLFLKVESECVKVKAKTLPTVLKTVNKVISEETHLESTNRLKNFLATRKRDLPEGELVCVHLDELIKEKILACRHQAVIAAILLGHLVKEKMLPEGIVRQYRATIQQNENIRGAHTWAVFRDKKTESIWLCDPTWKVVKEVEPHDEALQKHYGNITLNEMKKRLDKLDCKALPISTEPDGSDIYQSLLQQFSQCSSEFFLHPGKKCNINPGAHTFPVKHLRIEFAEEKHVVAFTFALKQQKISFQRGKHDTPPNPFVMISAENNLPIFSLNMDVLQKDFKSNLVLNEKNEVGKIEKEEKEVVEMMGNLNLLTFAKGPNVIKIKESASRVVKEDQRHHYSRTKSEGNGTKAIRKI